LLLRKEGVKRDGLTNERKVSWLLTWVYLRQKVLNGKASVHPKIFSSSILLVYLVRRDTEQGMFWYKYLA
jgi:hypothetical protein